MEHRKIEKQYGWSKKGTKYHEDYIKTLTQLYGGATDGVRSPKEDQEGGQKSDADREAGAD